MPVFQLPEEIHFPHPDLAEADGLLAVGGDLSIERLLAAYAHGIFPWYSRRKPILWWSPDPRMVLFPGEFHLSRTMGRILRSGRFRFTADTAFPAVIRGCAQSPRPQERGTWIVRDMIRAYCALHEAGWAHSIEVWCEDNLAGGLYGVSLGGAFFGESMFSLVDNASKAAFYLLARLCRMWNFSFIDCQMHTAHLSRLGAREISRDRYLQLLSEALHLPTRRGCWKRLLEEAAGKTFPDIPILMQEGV